MVNRPSTLGSGAVAGPVRFGRLGLSLAVVATPNEREVVGAELEAVLVAGASFNVCEELGGYLDDGATVFADEMGVAVVGEVVHGAPVA